MDDGAVAYPAVLRVIFSAAPRFQLNAIVRSGRAHAALDRHGELHDLVALIHGLIAESQVGVWTGSA